MASNELTNNHAKCETKRTTEGYRLSKPLSTIVTDLYIDDLKIYADSEKKLNTALRSTRGKMQDSGLQWNPKKCSVVHVKKGVKVEDVEGVKFDEASVIQCLKEGKQYNFLGVLETSRQQDQLAFEIASGEYLTVCYMVQPSFKLQSSGSIKPVCLACAKLSDVDPTPASHRPSTNRSRSTQDRDQ